MPLPCQQLVPRETPSRPACPGLQNSRAVAVLCGPGRDQHPAGDVHLRRSARAGTAWQALGEPVQASSWFPREQQCSADAPQKLMDTGAPVALQQNEAGLRLQKAGLPFQMATQPAPMTQTSLQALLTPGTRLNAKGTRSWPRLQLEAGEPCREQTVGAWSESSHVATARAPPALPSGH